MGQAQTTLQITNSTAWQATVAATSPLGEQNVPTTVAVTIPPGQHGVLVVRRDQAGTIKAQVLVSYGNGTSVEFQFGVVDHDCTDRVVLRATDVLYDEKPRGQPGASQHHHPHPQPPPPVYPPQPMPPQPSYPPQPYPPQPYPPQPYPPQPYPPQPSYPPQPYPPQPLPPQPHHPPPHHQPMPPMPHHPGGHNPRDFVNTGRRVHIESILGPYVLHVQGEKAFDGAPITLWDKRGHEHQHHLQWMIASAPKGFYLQSAANPSFVLHQTGESQSNDGPISLWNSGTNGHQLNLQVHLEPRGEYYAIKFLHSGKYIQVEGEQASNGAKVTQWEYLNQNNFLWRITPC